MSDRGTSPEWKSGTPKDSGLRPYHGGDMEQCGHCNAIGGSGLRMLRCSACKNEWYCGEECSRSAWKEHRPACKAAKAFSSDISDAEREALLRIVRWTYKNRYIACCAGLDGLLEHRDYLTQQGSLVETHVVHITIRDNRSSGFLVEAAEVVPQAAIELAFNVMGKPDRWENALAWRPRGESRPLLGVAKIALDFHGPTFGSFVWVLKSAILTEDAEVVKTKKHIGDWQSVLKTQTGLDGKTYELRDGRLAVVREGWKLIHVA